MNELFEMSNDEIKELVRDGLEDLGVELDSIDIEVDGDSSVLLRGRAPSRRLKELIAEAVEDALGADDIVNQLVVTRGNNADENAEDDDDECADLKDGDDDTIGTDDLGRSVEDGIPYIPPVKRAYRENPGRAKCRISNDTGHDTERTRRKR